MNTVYVLVFLVYNNVPVFSPHQHATKEACEQFLQRMTLRYEEATRNKPFGSCIEIKVTK